MSRDLSIKEIINLLVEKLQIEYGGIEIKVHGGKWTNYTLSLRTNYNETETNAILDQIKEKDGSRK